MTPDELAAKAAVVRGYLERWLPLAAVVVLALVLVRQCNGRRSAEAALEAERARAGEARQLTDAGVEVVDQEEQRAVDAEVRRLEVENADLRAANEQFRRAAPGARATGAVQASTGRIVAAVLHSLGRGRKKGTATRLARRRMRAVPSRRRRRGRGPA